MMGAVTDYLCSRVTDLNSNADVCIVGPRGCAKSFTALRLGSSVAERMGTPFSIKDSVHFTAVDMLRRIDYLTGGKDPDEVQPGIVLILDEAGLSADAQKWFDENIQGLAQEMEVFRTYKFVVLLTSPMVANVTKRIRGLVTAIMKPLTPKIPQRLDLERPTTNIDFVNKVSSWRFYLLWGDPAPTKSGAASTMPLYRPRSKQGVLSVVKVGLPPEDLLVPYEKKKRLYLDRRRQEKIKDLSSGETDIGDIEYVKRILKDKNKYGKDWRGKWIASGELITGFFGTSDRRSKRLKKLAESQLQGNI